MDSETAKQINGTLISICTCMSVLAVSDTSDGYRAALTTITLILGLVYVGRIFLLLRKLPITDSREQ